MSFLSTVNKTVRAEELRSAFNSLNHDILRQQGYNPPTPPLSPESPLLMQQHTAARQTHSMVSAPPSVVFETRGEPTSVISSYEKTRAMTSTLNANKIDNMNRYPSYSEHSSGSCLCCPQQKWTNHPTVHVVSRPSYDVDINNPAGEFTKTMMREADGFYLGRIPTNNMAVLPVAYPNDKVPSKPPSMKRRYEVTGAPIDMEIPEKKLKLNNETIACQVHGILSLPGSREPNYDISKSELQRRVNEPECLTKVDMIAYVRLAKNSARTLLEKNDIKTNQHNKRSEHTVLSKMCEAECQVLAQGLREINFRYFPGMWFAKKSVEEISANSNTTRQQREALKERLKEDEITKCVLLDIYFGLERRNHDNEMKNFNLMSHSFGIPNLKNHILFLYRYLEEEARILKTIFTHH